MENKPRLPHEELQQEPSEEVVAYERSHEPEMVAEHSKEFFANVIPQALDSREQSEIKIAQPYYEDYPKQTTPERTHLNIENSDVEKSSDNVFEKVKTEADMGKESLSLVSEMDFDKHHEAKEKTLRFDSPSKTAENRYFAIPVSEVVARMKVGGQRISPSNTMHPQNIQKTASLVAASKKTIIAGFIAGVGGLIVVAIIST